MEDLKIIKNTIAIGLNNPIKFLHITDSHICRDDTTGWNRKAVFDVEYDGCAKAYFLKAIEYAKTNNMPIIHTGDLIDFLSEGNLKFINEYFPKDIDYLYAAGNHDFVDFNDIKKGQKETKEYKEKQINSIAPQLKNNLYFSSKIIGGANIVAMDDSYYQISDGQIDMLKAEAAKGYPIILCMHVPLSAPDLSRITDENIAYVLGAPKELLATYSESRRAEQTPDEATLRAIDYIKNEPLIKALITGHRHINHEEKLDNGIVQYTTHGSFAGYVREFTLI